jgi:hypothetical protein
MPRPLPPRNRSATGALNVLKSFWLKDARPSGPRHQEVGCDMILMTGARGTVGREVAPHAEGLW